MADGIHFISWGGVASSIVGGVIHLISWRKGREAAQLETVETVDRISDLKGKAKQAPLLVAVSGKVWTDAPLKCELTGKSAAIAEVKEEQQFMRQVNSGEWVRDQHVVRQTWRESPWCLEDASHARLPVIQSRLARRLNLELAGDVFTPAEKSVSQRAIDHLMGWRVLGQRHKERILPLDATLTAIGELAASSAEGTACKGAIPFGGPGSVLVLQAPRDGGPFILSHEKLPEIVASLNRMSRTCKLIANCFIGVGTVLITIKAIQGARRFLHRRKLRKRLDAEAQRRRLMQQQNGVHTNGHTAVRSAARLNGEERVREHDLCSVCIDREADTVFQACGHMCVCEHCALNLVRCPLCRARSRTIRVFRT